MAGAGEKARKLARGMPRPVREGIRTGLKRYRSARYRVRERLNPTTLTTADVAEALRECGLTSGDACFMQAAMSAFGGFEDGPASVVDGIEEVVGQSGLIAMPAYSLTGPAIEHLAADPLFDPRETPSRMGAISEEFRLREGTQRSVHPTHSTAVRGSGAEAVIAGHHAADTPFGEGTPFPRIRDLGALQLFFGCGTGAITMYHSFECLRDPPFPLDVFAPRRYDARCIDLDGRPITMSTLVHNPALHPGRIDSNPRLQASFRDAILGAGGKAVRLGRGEIIAIRLPALFVVFEELLESGITIYDNPLPANPPALPPQERGNA